MKSKLTVTDVEPGDDFVTDHIDHLDIHTIGSINGVFADGNIAADASVTADCCGFTYPLADVVEFRKADTRRPRTVLYFGPWVIVLD